MILESARLKNICTKRYNGEDSIIIDNKYLIPCQSVIVDQLCQLPSEEIHDNMNFSVGQLLTVIPIDDVYYCTTKYDLSLYGFEQIGHSIRGTKWINKNFVLY